MGIWLSEEECQHILEYIDEDKSGEIDAGEFDQKINILLSKKFRKDNWMVSKCSFLTAIADTYDKKTTDDNAKIKELFEVCDINEDGELDASEFENFVKQVDTEKQLTPEQVEELFKEASAGGSGITQPDLITLCQCAVFKQFGCEVFDAKKILKCTAVGENAGFDMSGKVKVGKNLSRSEKRKPSIVEK